MKMVIEFKRTNPSENKVANIPPRVNINNLPKSPSVLILTDSEIDAEGRFGEGKKLGWLKQKSDMEDERAKLSEQSMLSMAQREEKNNGGKDKDKIKEPKKGRQIIVAPLSSDRAMAQLREQSVLPMTSLSEIKEIATYYSKQFGIPIVVSSEMGDNRYVDAMACMESGRVKIHLHPILQYRDRGYIGSAILREIEECRDFMKERAFGWQRGR